MLAVSDPTYRLRPVGRVQFPLTDRDAAPKQGDEGTPLARVVFRPEFRDAAGDLRKSDEMLVLTWLHQARRDVLPVNPRDVTDRPRKGMFTTWSADRPNPIGLHAVVIETVEEDAITVHNLETIDDTPVLGIKPVLGKLQQR